MQRLTRDEMAQRVTYGTPGGAYASLDIGLPTHAANCLPADKEMFLYNRSGLLGMGPGPQPGEKDSELISAGKRYVAFLQGDCYFHHDDSFAMMRGDHFDICVLGAYQVSISGDLANWSTGTPDTIPAIGGAMDLAIGAYQVFVMMDYLTRDGECKLMAQYGYPLTSVGRVNRIYAGLAVIDITDRGPAVREIFNGPSFEELRRITLAALTPKQPAGSAQGTYNESGIYL